MSTPSLSSSGQPPGPPSGPPPSNNVSASPSANNIIPILLLKTQSQPHDSYYDCFSASQALPPSGSIRTPAGLGEAHDNNASSTTITSTSLDDHASVAADGATTVTSTTLGFRFQPLFVPVLEHHPNTRNLDILQDLLRSEQLATKYGGMIFTSQRAVEAWSEVVKRVEGLFSTPGDLHGIDGANPSSSTFDSPTGPQRQQPPLTPLNQAPQSAVEDDDSIFPLYSVGPATSRALNTLVQASQSSPSSPFSRIRPQVSGEHTGNGANLAQYILSHYNALRSQKAPKAFTNHPPNKGPPDLEASPPADKKRPLLFLVGEQRRDVIPKTLVDKECKLSPTQRIDVDEVEVYATGTMVSFQRDFNTHLESFKAAGPKLVVVVVVFSPQGCDAMLRALGYIDDERRLTMAARERWAGVNGGGDPTAEAAAGEAGKLFSVVIATIGPTTRDHLKDEFGFTADVCAEKPSPQGVRDGVLAFLREKKLV